MAEEDADEESDVSMRVSLSFVGSVHLFTHIIAIAWIYVVLMMSLTESSFIAGVMTFLMYCAVPLSIILYLMDAPRRKRRLQAVEKLRRDAAAANQTDQPGTGG
jgi:hypothetical protein